MADIARVAVALSGIAALLSPLAMADASAPAGETGRTSICGWIQNPTPANWWITDRFGQWVMGTQGGEQVHGMDVIPDLTAKQWVATNGSYGYGCGCLTATVDRKGMRIERIHAFKQKPLAVCRADPRLREPAE